jgi:hypothetical protein
MTGLVGALANLGHQVSDQTVGNVLRRHGIPRQTQFRRFLNNARVKVIEIIEAVGERTADLVGGRHVLAIQDTTEVNYQSQADRKHNLGSVGNGTDVGLFLHPVLAVDADDGSCLGLVHAQIWRRKKRKAANYRELPIEKKESHRWLVGANTAKQLLSTTAAWVTIVADRESDIFEQWARLPDGNTHLLSRASQDRVLCDAGRLFETMDAWPEATRYDVDLPSRPGKRRARRAVLAVRFRRGRDPSAPNLLRSHRSSQCALDGYRRARGQGAARRGTHPLAVAYDAYGRRRR